MLSFKIFLKAEKLRQAFGERHFGHFDREAVFMHGSCDDGSGGSVQLNGTTEGSSGGFDVVCKIEADPSNWERSSAFADEMMRYRWLRSLNRSLLSY